MRKMIADLNKTVADFNLKEIELRMLATNIEPRIKVRFITKDNRVFEKSINTDLMGMICESHEGQVWGWIKEEARANLRKD